MSWVACRLAALCLLTGLVNIALAAELPVFSLVFKEGGTFEPTRIEVPAGRFKLVLANESKAPVEFESLQLRKEKVLGPGVTSFVVLSISRPGEYPFFDDFHQDARGVLVVMPKP
ncbi:cupredoxin domain-containing protein [Alcaligenaceae bacterium]|nr:cupredoxin domain-containing protein [Alcaligenaceae bacterium]